MVVHSISSITVLVIGRDNHHCLGKMTVAQPITNRHGNSVPNIITKKGDVPSSRIDDLKGKLQPNYAMASLTSPKAAHCKLSLPWELSRYKAYGEKEHSWKERGKEITQTLQVKTPPAREITRCGHPWRSKVNQWDSAIILRWQDHNRILSHYHGFFIS